MILDGGPGVNVIEETTTKKMGLKWEPITFNVRMVDNHKVMPKGIVRNVRMVIKNMEFFINVVVIAMQPLSQESYQVLLGRPWLRDAKVKHDWKRDRILVRKGKKKTYIHFGTSKTCRVAQLTPLHAETFNMSEGLEDDEEEYLLKQNPNLMFLFMIDLEKILENKEVTLKEKPSHRVGKRIRREGDQESIEA